MSEHASLLEKEQYILPPNIDLGKNITTTKIDKGKGKCEKCGKVLQFSYYLLIGIPPSISIVDSHKCNNINDEKHRLDYTISEIKSEGKIFDIENKHQWIFSDQNITNSITRICDNCHKQYEWCPQWYDPHFLSAHIREVYFAVEEYQRRHTPISSTMSDYEKYLISLPDRSNVHYVGPSNAAYGIHLDLDVDYCSNMHEVGDYLGIALVPNYKISPVRQEAMSAALKELREDFIQDKNRTIPNDQELTRWMKKFFDGGTEELGIEFCKVFTNPRSYHVGDTVFKTKYSVIVHHDDTNWDEFYI
jgi:hypothetical protein